MSVVLARVDERLVHGQIITSWSKHLRASNIYIVDDEIARDVFMKEVLTLSAPKGLKFSILTVEEAVEKLNQEKNSDKSRIMILFKSIKTALILVESGYALSELNLGNIGSSPSRKKISKNISMDEEEVEVAKKLIDLGVDVYLQMIYTENKVPVEKVI